MRGRERPRNVDSSRPVMRPRARTSPRLSRSDGPADDDAGQVRMTVFHVEHRRHGPTAWWSVTCPGEGACWKPPGARRPAARRSAARLVRITAQSTRRSTYANGLVSTARSARSPWCRQRPAPHHPGAARSRRQPRRGNHGSGLSPTSSSLRSVETAQDEVGSTDHVATRGWTSGVLAPRGPGTIP